MYYSDFDKIEIDEFVGTKFGKENQLEVIGWCGRVVTHKYYVVFCHTCSQDKELFGDGIFRITKGAITLGREPCGCSNIPKWTEEQYYTRAKRKADSMGFKFLGWSLHFSGYRTKIRLLCNEHGEWDTGTLNHLMNERGCPLCKALTTSKWNKLNKPLPTEQMISYFMESCAFSPDTKFWKSDRKTKAGYQDFWCRWCPECGEVSETRTKDLKGGCKSCSCGTQRQQQAYINLVKDEDHIIAIKFGIANNSKVRVKTQNSKSIYEVVNHSIYEFPTSVDCKAAEKECLNKLDCGIIPKLEMLDGYTETTYPINIEEIIDIYKNFNGRLVDGGINVASNFLG